MVNGRGDGYLESKFTSVPIYLIGSKNGTKNADLAETNLLSLSYGNIVPKDIDGQKGLRPASFDGYQVVQPGYTILRFTDLQNDQKSLRSGLVTERGIITSAYIGFKPDTRLVAPAYFAYVMRALDVRKVFYQMGFGVRQSLGWDEFSAMRIPLPDLSTQRRIAKYLDKEVGEMDAMVARLEKLIEDLEARRVAKFQSLLHTFEYDEVPLGLVASVKLGKMLAKETSTKDLISQSYLRAAHIQPAGIIDWSVDAKKMLFTAREISQLTLLRDDILIVEGGAGVGRSVILAESIPNMGFQNSINRVRVDAKRVDPSFVYHYLQWAKENGLIEMLCDVATIPHFTSEKVQRFRIPLPDLATQRRIAAELDEETAAIDGIIARSRTLIDDLKARKSALITEVVTGRKQV